MKTLKWMILCLVCLTISTYALAQETLQDGTYFIINVATGNALIPVDASMNSNTRLKKFNKSGMQKWVVKKHTAKGKNGRKITYFTIQHAASELYLRPYFVPDNGNAIISDNNSYSNFTIEKDGGNFIVKSIKMGGDVMFSRNLGYGDDEPWFSPDNGKNTYRWKFILAE